MLFEIRNTLLRIIDKAYAQDEQIDLYKRFFLKLSEKRLKSKGGDYNIKTKSIRIFAFGGNNEKDMIVVALHELSHHIDSIQRKTTKHDYPFYTVYKNLIYACLDLNILTQEDIKWVVNNSNYSDGKKILAITNQYAPITEIDENKNKKIYVYNCFNIKDQLKEKGYTYNKIDNAWTLLIDDTELQKELSFLYCHVSINDIDIVEAQQIHYRQSNHIIVSGDTYPCKDILKLLGYKYINKGIWKKNIDREQLEEEANKLKNIIGIKLELK